MRNYLPSEVRLGERKITSISSHIFFCLQGSKKIRLKMAELNCGMKCLKFMLCVFNLFFWVSWTFDFLGYLDGFAFLS